MKRNGFALDRMLLSLAALFAALLADLVEFLVDPVSGDKGADVVAGATQHHGRMVLAAVMLLASAAFIVPAVFGLVRLLEHRGRALGRVATVLALLGALGHAALGGIYLLWSALPAAGGDNAQLVAALDRASGAGAMAGLAPLLIAFPIGLVVFFGAMVRGRIAPLWTLVPVLAAPIAASTGGTGTTGTVAALLLLLVAACALAVAALRAPRLPQQSADAPPLPA